MSPKKMPLLSLLVTALFCSSVLAAPVKIVGFDDMSCSAWTAANDDTDQRKQHVAWIRGLLTGHNYARQSQQVSAMSSGTIENFVDRYCRENPTGDFGDAAFRMSDRFSGRNESISK